MIPSDIKKSLAQEYDFEDVKGLEEMADHVWDLAVKYERERCKKYDEKELVERVKYLNEHGPLVYSNQYGFRYVLNQRGEIVLSLNGLLTPPQSDEGAEG